MTVICDQKTIAHHRRVRHPSVAAHDGDPVHATRGRPGSQPSDRQRHTAG
jgi:hypothetical protein